MRSNHGGRRTRLPGIVTAVAALLLAAACSGSALGDSGRSNGSGTLKIGLLTARSGVYKSVGDDMVNGLRLYLSEHDHELGGHAVQLEIADEGDGQLARAGAEKLVKQDKVIALTGIVDGGSAVNVQPVVASAHVPTILTSAGPSHTSDAAKPYFSSTSYASVEPGEALGRYLADHVEGPVYAIGPDYQGGHDEVGGFVDAFTKAGGKLANPDGKPAWTPFPSTTDFQPYLSKIRRSGAKAVFTFYAGAPAIDFVKQYHQFVGDSIPLYASGFLTEGSVLQAEGAAARGIRTSMNYAADLDNPANHTFVTAYRKAYHTDPTTYAMSAWDAGLLLDKAVRSAGDEPTASAVNDAIGRVGRIESPRGTWRLGANRSPVQKWYLRRVAKDGTGMHNRLVRELTTSGS